jgi:hypothetical protein
MCCSTVVKAISLLVGLDYPGFPDRKGSTRGASFPPADRRGLPDERSVSRRHPVQHIWKGFVIGATVGAGVGLLLDVLERAGEAGRELADEARGAAQELASEARMRAPEVRDAAQSAATTLADQATVAAAKAKDAVSDRASSTISSVRS